MIYLVSVILALFVILLLVVIWQQYKINKMQVRTNKFVRESLVEIEEYAYTDIRELNDYLNKVKAKWGVLDD